MRTYKTKAKTNRAIELLQLIQQVLETGDISDTDNTIDMSKDKNRNKNKDRNVSETGKNQSVIDYKDYSPLRFKGFLR